jgi:aminomethyltransferase
MGQLRIHGKDRIKFIEELIVADVQKLDEQTGTLSVFTNEQGGVIDDTIVNKYADHLYVVINAGCADKDIAHLNERLSSYRARNPNSDVSIEILTDRSLIAVQGPKAMEAVAKLGVADLEKQSFMQGRVVNIKGVECIITRCGYTGEDGFEISVPTSHIENVTREFLKDSEVKLAGLGPRDSLRLEAGLCLYGHELEENISPIEAGLLWTIGKRRREEGGFLGSDIILKQIKEGVQKKRVGLLVTGNIARDHAPILDPSNETQIGEVTSGTHSPSLKKAIAMAYVPTNKSKTGTSLLVSVRGKSYPALVTKLPFVTTNYFKSSSK